MEAAQLADDLKTQLELAQKKLHDFQDEIVENSVTKEKDMFNFKRAQVRVIILSLHFTFLGVSWALKWPMLWRVIGLMCVVSYFIVSSLSEETKSVFFTIISPEPVMVGWNKYLLNEWIGEFVK